jgi:hypothetical protein
VLRREYNGFYLIIVALTGIEIATDMIGEGDTFLTWLDEEPGWVLFFLAGSLVWVALRAIKRHTGWLTVSGR